MFNKAVAPSSYQKKAWWITRPISTFSYKTENIRSAAVADSVGDTFLNIHLPQQAPLPIPIHRPPRTIHDQSHETGLSHAAVQKIQEFKLLMNKYSLHHTNPDGIIGWAIYDSMNGNNTLLDSKLEQLRTLDSLAKYYAS